MTGLFHYFHHFVKGYTVITVCKGRIDIGVKSSGCRIGISFDTRDLYQSAYRIASHSQVVKIERNRKGYELTLENGLEVDFDQFGGFLKLSD